MIYLLLTLGALGAAVYAFSRRKVYFDKDRNQHHLASMLIAVVTQSEPLGRIDIVNWLEAQNWPAVERQKRVDHAVGLAGTAVSGKIFDDVTALARSLNFGDDGESAPSSSP